MIMDPISFSFPAQKPYAMLLRMAVTGAAASYDLPVDMLEDLRMAAEEAFDCLLSDEVKNDTQLICDMYRTEAHSATVYMRLSSRSGAPLPDQEKELVYAILRTLMNDVTLFADAKGIFGVRMTLNAEK
ncbi:MAG: hypothetical protein IJA59_05680 [Clostridia bacterium]|nr:hypothetical protein [Clostridia bacterium]